jgi:hypothetical protein
MKGAFPTVTRLARFWLICATVGFVAAIALFVGLAAIVDGRL